MTVLDKLKAVGALVTDSHLVYTSGRHGSAYVNKDAIYPHADLISECVKAMVEPFAAAKIEVVLAPALGGIILSTWAAHHLTKLRGQEVLSVYAEKDGDGFALRRGYDTLVAGKKILVLEDVLTTGGSVKKAVETAKAAKAEVMAVSALCNRGGVKAEELGVPKLWALLEVSLESWDERGCPLCARGVAINTTVGKGKEFLAKRR